jgi:two-component system nitrogen regulation response regulator GlnG
MSNLLIIDDEPDILLACLRHLDPHQAHSLQVARSGAEALALAPQIKPDVVLLDLMLPDISGLDVFASLKAIDGRSIVIFITASTMADRAIEAMKRGAYDYLYKPVDVAQLRQVLTQALEVSSRMRTPAVVGETSPTDVPGDAIIGHCSAMREVYKSTGRVAAQDVTVLINGESGTGKELAARAIYQHSLRADKPFLAINSAAIPEALLESELFGHEKGAFTSADRRRIGKFEQCNGGTLFFDEIGDMPLVLQAKLLRVLQEQTFERVGGSETIRTNVRVIAATHHNLPALVEQGRFRADLYYRLSVFTIELPPLRDRGEDFPALVRHYLKRYNRELGKQVTEVPKETFDLLLAYSWPGNIRELQSVLKQALLKATGPVLVAAFLPDFLQRPSKPIRVSGQILGSPSQPTPTASTPAVVDELEAFVRSRLAEGSQDLYAEAQAFMERTLIPLVLERVNGSQTKAAAILGITRRTLRTRLRDLNLSTGRGVDSAEDED